LFTLHLQKDEKEHGGVCGICLVEEMMALMFVHLLHEMDAVYALHAVSETQLNDISLIRCN